MISAPIRAHFEHQARVCDQLGSPFTAKLCRALADTLDRSTAVGRAVDGWVGDPGADALSLRLCGGLHGLVLSGADEELAAIFPPNEIGGDRLSAHLSDALDRNHQALLNALDHPPQTNEVARAAMLLPGLLALARRFGLPIHLCEIGSSAGLNLNLDRFRYDYAGLTWGDPASRVALAPSVRGTPPPLDGNLLISRRAGCDISPVDLSDAAQRLRLRSYIWADQKARLDRLDAAIEIAGHHPFSLVKESAGTYVGERLSAHRAGTVLVVLHSIMWQYMPRETKESILATLDEAGRDATADRPIARLRMEPLDTKDGYATLSLTTWPGGRTDRLAQCDYHGRWLAWIDR